MEPIFYVLILIAFCVASLLSLVYIRVQLNPLKRIPGTPFRRPIFGDFIQFIEEKCQLLELIKRDKAKYGSIRRIFMFLGRIRLQIGDPYWIKHVMVLNSKNYRRGDFTGGENIFMAIGENGLIVVDGELHKRLRKLASPAFKLSQLKKVMPIIETCGERMVKLFRIRCDENKNYFPDGGKTTEIMVKEILNKTTLDVIGLIAFGHDFKEACTFDPNTFGSHLREWLDAGQELSLTSILPNQILIKKCIINLTKILPNFIQESRLLKLAHITNVIHNLVNGVVQSKIEEKRDKTKNGSMETNPNSKTLLDFILDANDSKHVCKKEVHDILMTFLLAGHETSTLVITWTLYLLAKNPAHQDRCREEVKQFFDYHEGPVSWDDVHKFTFINAVVHESLRLYPPIPWLEKYSNGPDKIGDYEIPANCDIVLLLCEMQRNEDYWPNPDDFKPERFLEPHDTIPWEAYMPFGDGIHKCIGYQLALIEINYFMAILLKNFEFSIDNSIQYKEFVALTMRPKPAMKLMVKVLQ